MVSANANGTPDAGARARMGSVRIVTRHEFRTAVTRPSYIILTAAVPVLVALAVAGFAIFTLVTREDAGAETASSAESSAETPRLGYVDLTDGPALFGAYQEQPGAVFVAVSDRDAGIAALMDEQIAALFVFAPDFAETGTVVRVRIADDGGVFGPDGPSYSGTLRGFVLSNLFADEVPAGLAERLQDPLHAGDGGGPARRSGGRVGGVRHWPGGVLCRCRHFAACFPSSSVQAMSLTRWWRRRKTG